MTSRGFEDPDPDNLKTQKLGDNALAREREAQVLDVTTQNKLEEFPRGLRHRYCRTCETCSS
ncbi:hypothetical protein B0H12DRAFT_1133821 [Mycena haematopus]|nr:hypothetical protein B0H12DRAFT_1148139 [Mycena haematopus]KAJ7241198.1 hypothetical protein B0H12DRAFT_1133821 [Mycena haematopus]